MFEYLSKYKKIIVTGPHRSGTRICGRMISFDLGYPFVDEKDIHFDSLYAFSHYLFNDTPYVIHCPALSRYIHYFESSSRVIVFLKRNPKEIVASQKRINWTWQWLERLRYNKTSGDITEIKYDYWDTVQKKKLKNCQEINYKDLSEHPLWESEREGFSPDHYTISSIESINVFNLYPIRSPGTVFYKLGDQGCGILINHERKAKQLNESACSIWHLCSGFLMTQEIQQKIAMTYITKDPDREAEESLKFMIELEKEGLIQFLNIPLAHSNYLD